MQLGALQVTILRRVHGGRRYDAPTRTLQRAALALHDRGLLARDPANAYRWISKPEGDRAIQQHDTEARV
jgi:hypothetical protein